jgi:hypothetical protein
MEASEPNKAENIQGPLLSESGLQFLGISMAHRLANNLKS